MYKRALDADPKHPDNLGYYALFLENVRKDFGAAEAMYKRALDADPRHMNNLGNYAKLCLSIGRVSDGMELANDALALRSSADSPLALDAELWMYVFCCGSSERHHGALQQLRALVLTHAIKTGDWDFSSVIEQARALAHPEADWLPVLADALAGRRPATALDEWPAWRVAAKTPDTEGHDERPAS